MPSKWPRIAKAGIFAIGTLTLFGLALLSVVTRRWGWSLPLELLSHFQRQYFGLGLLLLTLLLLLKWQSLLGFFQTWAAGFKSLQGQVPTRGGSRRPQTMDRVLVLAIASMVVLSGPIVPWFVPAGTAATSAPTLKVLFSNLNVGNQDFSPLLALIERERPDIVALAEVSPEWEAPLAALKPTFPYQAGQTATDPFGLKVLSQYPFTQPELLQFDDGPVSMAMQLEVEQRPLTLVVTHPVPPIRPTLFHSRNRQLDGIADYSTTRSTPVVLIGDLNITPWSPYYRRFAQKTGLRNTRQGFGTLPTWPVSSPVSSIPNRLHPFLGIPIDHCLIDPALHVVEMHTGANVNSDHRPIVVTLSLS